MGVTIRKRSLQFTRAIELNVNEFACSISPIIINRLAATLSVVSHFLLPKLAFHTPATRTTRRIDDHEIILRMRLKEVNFL